MFCSNIIKMFTLSIMETREGYGLTGISILTPPIVYVNNGRSSDLVFDIVTDNSVQLYTKIVKVDFYYVSRKYSLNYNTNVLVKTCTNTIYTAKRTLENGSYLK